MPLALLSFAFTVLTSTLSRQRARRKAARARAEAREAAADAAAIEVRAPHSGESVPILYGYTGTRGLQAYSQSANAIDGLAGGLGALAEVQGMEREVLLMQLVGGPGLVSPPAAVYIDKRRVHPLVTGETTPFDRLWRLRLEEAGTVYAQVAATFADRTAQSQFRGYGTYFNAFFDFDRGADEPPFVAAPDLYLALPGAHLAEIRRDGARYYLGALKSHTANPARAVADYMTSGGGVTDLGYGPHIRTDEIDWRSFHEAQEICDQVIAGAADQAGVWNQPYPAELNALLGTAHGTWGAYLRTKGFSGPGDNGLEFPWDSGTAVEAGPDGATVAATPAATWLTGTGTQADPYVITDPTDVNGRSILALLRGQGFGDSAASATYFRFTVPADNAGTWGIRLDGLPASANWDLAGDHGLAGRSGTPAESDTATLAVADVVNFRVWPDQAADRAALTSYALTLVPPGALAVETDAATLAVDEGSTARLRVRLGSRPSGAVMVALRSADTGAVRLSAARLDFDQNNWNVFQPVTVTALEDSDNAGETVTVSLDPSGGGYDAAPTATVPVTVTDNDTPGVLTDILTLALPEGATGRLRVKLATQPSGAVAVAISSSDTGAVQFGAGPVHLANWTLNFDRTNWNTWQAVTVAAVQDADAGGETVTLTLDPSGSDYAAAPSRQVTVTVTDDDTPAVETDLASIALDEGSTARLRVRLATQPSGTVQVAVTSSDIGAVTVSDASLDFDASNWNSWQPVTLTGVEDSDTAGETVAISLNPSGADYARAPTKTVSVTVSDDDMAGVLTDLATIAIEEGMTARLRVKLSQRPTGAVEVAVSSSDREAVSVPAGAPGYWAEFVRSSSAVSLTEDAAGSFVWMRTSDGMPLEQEYQRNGVWLTDTQIRRAGFNAGNDADEPDFAFTNGWNLRWRARRPGGDWMPSSNGIATNAVPWGGRSVYRFFNQPAVSAALDFDENNWNTWQPVTLTAEQDPDAAGETVTISLDPAGANYETAATATVSVTVTDDESPGVETDLGAVAVDEGMTARLQVRLRTQPTGAVAVAVGSSDTGAVTASPTVLNFDASNWNTYQPVTLTGVQDADAAGETVTISLDPSGSDYASVATKAVQVTVTDDDTPSVVADLAEIAVDEGSTARLQVKLATQPTGDVTVAVRSSDVGAVTVSVATLDFDASDWDTWQPVTLTGVEDLDAAGETVTISLDPSGADYQGLPARTVAVTVTDDDVAAAVVTDLDAIALDEGSTARLRVKLSRQPTGTVRVNVTTDDLSAVRASTTQLQFDASNWNTWQPVTLTGADDADDDHETVTVSLDPSGADYQNAPTKTVSVTLTDDDDVSVIVDKAVLSITEGETGTFKVKLSRQPLDTTVVTILSSDTGAVANPALVVFTALNWEVEQDVTLRTVEDEDIGDETVTISLNAVTRNHQEVLWRGASITVTVTDDDVPAVMSDLATVAVNEGATARLRVKLATEPSGAVAVAVASSDTGAVTVSAATLNFDASNWNTWQPVTLTGVQDADTGGESVTVSLDPSGSDYAQVATRNVTVTVADDDEPPGPVRDLAVSEGDAELTYSWNAPNTGGTATAYEYRHGTTASLSGAWTETTARRVTIGSLQNGTTYYFEVRAKNAFGTSSASTASGMPTSSAPQPVSFTDGSVDKNSSSARASGAVSIPEAWLARGSGATFASVFVYASDGRASVTFAPTTVRVNDGVLRNMKVIIDGVSDDLEVTGPWRQSTVNSTVTSAGTAAGIAWYNAISQGDAVTVTLDPDG